ncbi:hypothetical protein NIES46_01520 [Arthrospira platensis NIES-46]|uniref:Cyanoexosortase B system-associated protein n=1 Tax=Limnospira platensis NIES-46 TaxID=1236695 RepID=A0A5M3T063_LIMPL|nr:cyanoexosortase B system-associated protein [Arthrospira platensis]GCE92117.1 hypothetical protein NIES46_01520 [Arthrospira platensis NIES-46]
MDKSAPNLEPTSQDTPKLQLKPSQWVLLGFLLLLFLVGTLPGFFRGSWSWSDMPDIQALPQLQTIRREGLTVPGWETTSHDTIQVGARRWSLQTLQQNDTEVLVLLFPQNYYKDQPQVEWMDLQGLQSLRTDSYRALPLSLDSPQPVTVNARFFRAWNPRQTYALVQWYAWHNGGSPAPSQWFFADRQAQLRGDRAPWVAVSIMIPIEPLGDIETVATIAQSLGQDIQKQLMTTIFQPQ